MIYWPKGTKLKLKEDKRDIRPDRITYGKCYEVLNDYNSRMMDYVWIKDDKGPAGWTEGLWEVYTPKVMLPDFL